MNRLNGNMCKQVFFIWIVIMLSMPSLLLMAEERPMAEKRIVTYWGGYIRLQDVVSWPDDKSFLRTETKKPDYDAVREFRLKNKLIFSDHLFLETHYEASYAGGDTQRQKNSLLFLFPELVQTGALVCDSPDDQSRLMDFTAIISEDEDYYTYHRLDRFSLSFTTDFSVFRIGRQALTWGNGLLFNPMDLFNPFSPTDINREYKVGDDMAMLQWYGAKSQDFQLLYVPRRNPITENIEWDYSSLAGKLHFSYSTTEIDILAAKHYNDYVIGIGSRGYFKNAAWRMDVTYTILDYHPSKSGFLSMVTNMDYSWTWNNKNMYGLIEFYYNGLGKKDYFEALSDISISRRIQSGELYVLGNYYLGSELQIEWHPLVKSYLTMIVNLSDPSVVCQPRLVLDVIDNFQITIGGNIYEGKPNTEFGGFQMSDWDFLIQQNNSAYLWISYYF